MLWSRLECTFLRHNCLILGYISRKTLIPIVFYYLFMYKYLLDSRIMPEWSSTHNILHIIWFFLFYFVRSSEDIWLLLWFLLNKHLYEIPFSFSSLLAIVQSCKKCVKELWKLCTLIIAVDFTNFFSILCVINCDSIVAQL